MLRNNEPNISLPAQKGRSQIEIEIELVKSCLPIDHPLRKSQNIEKDKGGGLVELIEDSIIKLRLQQVSQGIRMGIVLVRK